MNELEVQVFQLRALYFETQGNSGQWRAIELILDDNIPLSREDKKRALAPTPKGRPRLRLLG